MDNAIDEECLKLNCTLDFECIKSKLLTEHTSIKDDNVVDTLYSILDFQKFKKMMIAFQKKNEPTLDSNQIKTHSSSINYQDLSNIIESDAKLLILSRSLEGWIITHQ